MKGLLIFVLGVLPFRLYAAEDFIKKEVLEKFQSYGQKLKSELLAAMKEKGAPHAVKVCKERAQQIASDMATDQITIGRVSHKPRNVRNKLRDWMKIPVKNYLDGEQGDEGFTVSIDASTTGYLKPIKTGGLCLTCHGENLSSEVKKILLSHYPADQAVGFKVGEVRGFFFSEVKNNEPPQR